MNVDFDDAGVGCQRKLVDAFVGWRGVAFEAHRLLLRGGCRFNRGYEREIIFKRFDRRHEHVEDFFAHFHTQCGTHNFGCGLAFYQRGFGWLRVLFG